MYLFYPLFLLLTAALLLAINLRSKALGSKAVSFYLMWVCIVWALIWATCSAILISVYVP